MNRLTLDRAKSLLAAARDINVLVVGDLMLDVYLQGTALRISPEAPVPVVRVEEEWRALGGAANVASNIVVLGSECTLCGVVGRDKSGDVLRDELQGAGIGTGGLVALERPTTVKTRVLARHHQIARYDHELDDDITAAEAALVVDRIVELASKADVIIIEDYNKGVLVRDVIEGCRSAAKQHGIPLVVDPKSRFFFDYHGAAVFKPNMPELAGALRERVRPDDAEWMEETRRRLGCENLLLTLGEEGMALMTSGGEHVRVPTVARAVHDVSGAGDTVIAVVAVALAAGANVVEAAVLANHAAGIEVGKAGVATVSPEELLASIELSRAATA
jgi:D-beta-D-heptose 7-phosphate kinase/D-beta-D-heptose 1-phosphate adenosyltransferase